MAGITTRVDERKLEVARVDHPRRRSGAGGGSIFLERLPGWMDVEGREGAESGEIVQRMWCGSSLLMLEILFGYQ